MDMINYDVVYLLVDKFDNTIKAVEFIVDNFYNSFDEFNNNIFNTLSDAYFDVFDIQYAFSYATDKFSNR